VYRERAIGRQPRHTVFTRPVGDQAMPGRLRPAGARRPPNGASIDIFDVEFDSASNMSIGFRPFRGREVTVDTFDTRA
jgi:hypothetical protein